MREVFGPIPLRSPERVTPVPDRAGRDPLHALEADFRSGLRQFVGDAENQAGAEAVAEFFDVLLQLFHGVVFEEIDSRDAIEQDFAVEGFFDFVERHVALRQGRQRFETVPGLLEPCQSAE